VSVLKAYDIISGRVIDWTPFFASWERMASSKILDDGRRH
jgi:hypothetical protein